MENILRSYDLPSAHEVLVKPKKKKNSYPWYDRFNLEIVWTEIAETKFTLEHTEIGISGNRISIGEVSDTIKEISVNL